jgi:ribosomal-protein-alanine N-acetyltransferase
LTYSIRPMCKEDLAQVTEIDREAFPTQVPPANYRQELQNQLARYIVACDDNITIEEPELKPEGGLSRLISRITRRFHRNRSPDDNPPPAKRQYIVGFSGIWVLSDEAHITNIAVRQRYQHQGIGELLLIATIDLSKEMKANIMTLEVRASNIAAQNLYRKYGFTQVGTRLGYYLDNREDGIIMSTESIASTSFQTRLQELREALARKCK